MLALFAVFAFSAVVASSASALNEEWLFKGEKITVALKGLLDGLINLEHLGGITGVSKVHCTGQFHGNFGPGKLDLITDVLGLNGELADETHEGPIHCEFITGTCGMGALALVFVHHLPWLTELLLPGGGIAGTWDLIKEDGTHGEPGYEVECDHLGIKVLCEGSARAKFDENLANGALFLFLGVESLVSKKCSDGGNAVLTGMGEALGFTVS